MSLGIGGLARGFVVAALLASPAPAAAAGDSAGSADEDYKNLAQALKNGDYGVTLRYRYEFVEDDGFDKDAQASTLRTTLWYESASFRRLWAYLEFENVTDLGLADDHNDSQNGVTDRPAIVDPPTTEVNQGTLGYRGLRDTELVLGRREIVLDEARFVGNVLWRQNYQSFDAFHLTQQSLPRTRITYAFLNRVHTVRGQSQDIDAHLLNANVDLGRFGTAVAYYYRLDFDAATLSPLSSASYGASWQQRFEAGEYGIPVRLEVAQQNDVGDNPGTIDAGYLHANVGVKRNRWGATLGYELLEGGDDGKFSTPLATLFKFNGWADKFLVTPDNGLRDLYVSGTYGRESYSTILAFHRFDADSGGMRYGDELDFRFVYTAPWEQQFLFQVAAFSGDESFTDATKAWLMTRYAF